MSTHNPPGGRRRQRVSVGISVLTALVLTGLVLAVSACATTSALTTPAAGKATVINVVAAENFWGSLAAQLGGIHAHVISVMTNPNADPHDYEPTAADARAIATAQVAIINGLGYDTWATKLADTNPDANRQTLTVGDIVGAKDGDNPHRWYNPDDVRAVITQITAGYKKADPADAAYFDAQNAIVLGTNLKAYFDTIAQIKATYAGTPVGASESIFAMISPALGLSLLTPPTFLRAISEGADVTAADKTTIDQQIATRQIKVYTYNTQNATPDVQRQVNEARAAAIPVTTITETMTPADATFQDWQVAQLSELETALAQTTGV